MVIREGRDIPRYPRAGLEDGWQIGSIQTGGLLTSAMMGENGSSGVKGTERVCVGEVSKKV